MTDTKIKRPKMGENGDLYGHEGEDISEEQFPNITPAEAYAERRAESQKTPITNDNIPQKRVSERELEREETSDDNE